MRLLVTGGAGYIGSVVTRHLRTAGHEPTVLDDLSAGHREAVTDAELVHGDVGDHALVVELIARRGIEGVVHLAASCLVAESLREPARYYRNNLERSLTLLEAMREADVRRFVLSSTAAVYGEPTASPIAEEHATNPSNPYGETKLALERALGWYQSAYGLGFVSLRYFNAAGASADGTLGEDHSPETHLIPSVLKAAIEGEAVPVYGTDYATEDGTAVRDYVHVEDLAEAHLLSLERLRERQEGAIYNLGSGTGFSVHQVIEVARRVTGRRISMRQAPRRPGDPARLVASAGRAGRDLLWTARRPGLESIIESAWRFLRDHPRGYGS